MNAEQLQAMKINQERAAAERIRRENAVALLAEKERELERSRARNASLVAMFDSAQLRAEAAEERLQEAQAHAECDAADWSDTHTGAEIEIADLRERLREREAELEQRDPTGRTPKDYAIEFGEYLAKAAEQYLEQRNLYDANESDSDSLMDAWRALRSSIGEFRKRAARAALPSPPKEAK